MYLRVAKQLVNLKLEGKGVSLAKFYIHCLRSSPLKPNIIDTDLYLLKLPYIHSYRAVDRFLAAQGSTKSTQPARLAERSADARQPLMHASVHGVNNDAFAVRNAL